MRVTIKWRFLLKLAAVVTVALVAITLVHRWQVRNQAGAFLRQADLAKEAAATAEAAGNSQAADAERGREVSFLSRFLLARPDDVDVRERLARLLLRTARTARQLREAHLALEETLRRDPSRDGLRRLVVDLTVDPRLGLTKEAEGHIRVLLKKKPDDGELEGLLARCLVYNKQFEDKSQRPGDEGAETMYALSVKHRPDLIDSHLGLAFVRRVELKKNDEADQAIVAMLKANPDKFRALLGAAAYLRDLNIPALAVGTDVPLNKYAWFCITVETLVDDARRVAPDELDVLLAAADMKRAQARNARGNRNLTAAEAASRSEAAFKEARQLLGRAIEVHPKQPAAYLVLAALEAETGRPADALAVVQKGLAALPGSADLSLAKLDYQYRAGDAAGAAGTLEALKSAGLPADVAELQRLRVLALKEQWKDVAPALERLAPELQDEPLQFRQAKLLLGRCYEQLGEHQKRLAAYRDALERPRPLSPGEPFWGEAMLGVAESQAALGQADAARDTYRLMSEAGYTVALVPVARLELLRALREPDSKKRDWKPAEEALAAAEKVLPAAAEVPLLRAVLTHHKGNPAEARRQLEKLAAERPREVAVRVELAMQGAREQNPARGLAALAAAEKDVGDWPELRLARANLWAAAHGGHFWARFAFAPKLAELAAGAEKFGPAGRGQLLRGLAEVASRAGADDAAGRLWDELAQVRPFDLGVHLARFDRASRAGDAAAMGRILAQIADVDGENGQYTRLARAAVLIRQSRDAKDPGPRDRALELLNGLEGERLHPPLSGRVALAQGLIHDAAGNPDAAIEKFRRAVDLGEANPDVLRRLAELLALRGSATEAGELLSRLPREVADSPDAQRLAAAMSLAAGKNDDAIKRALAAVPQDSAKPEDRLWLGRVHWAAGKRAEAVAHFRRAAELRPEAMDGWLALVEALAATGRRDEAARTFEQAREKVAKTDRPLFVALGYARIGEPQKALDAYKQARAEKPDDAAIAFGEAELLFRFGRLAEAREGFRRVAAMPSAPAAVRAAARRQLALATAADPDYQTSRQAVELLAGTLLGPPTGNETPAELRGRAAILALQRDRKHRLEAIRLLEENTQGRTPSEQFLLAQLHNQVGNRDRVRVVLTDLLKTPKNQTPLYVGYFAGWLLREGDPGAAAEWVGVLEKLDKDSLRTAELKARLAAARKDPAAARAAIVPKADAPGARVDLIARVCEDLGLYDDAERLLERFVAEENKAGRPAAVLVMAAYYGRRGRTAEALRVWDEARSKLPADRAPALGAVAVDVLHNAPAPKPDEVAGVARWLDEAAGRAQGATKAAIQQQLAVVRDLLQGDHAAAAALYREVIAANPRDAVAMNNLAILYSLHDKRHDEALALIERAKKVIGPTNPELLDTEALIRLEKGEAGAAVKLLEAVTAEAPSGSAYFHLARAHDAAKNEPEARRAWDRAKQLGLKPADLHPLERPGFQALRRFN